MAASTLDPNEIDALMTAISDGAVPVEKPRKSEPGAAYDLTSQDRIIRGQMPTLDNINEQIASAFAAGLGGRLRTMVRMRMAPASLLKFSEFNALLAPPATVAVLSLGGTHGLAVVVLEEKLARALLNGALGDRKGRADEPAPMQRRDLTAVERVVMRKLLTLLTDAMGRAWAGILPLTPEVLRFETDPRLAAIAPPTDVAILTSFDVDIGNSAVTGTIQLGIPYTTVEPIKKLLVATPRSSGGSDHRFLSALTRELDEVRVDVVAELGRAHLTLDALLALSPGDVLPLDTAEAAPVPVFVQGRKKLLGHPDVRHGHLAIHITELTDGH